MARHPFVRAEARARLRAAVESVEEQSAAEVVIAVQPWSGSYPAGPFLVGALLSEATLLFMIFAPPVFPLWAMATGAPLVFAATTLVTWFAWPLRVGLAGRARVDRAVETGAQATFTRLGVSLTRDRSGILVYVSLLEGRAMALADVGVRRTLGQEGWQRAAESLAGTIRSYGVRARGVEALARAIEALGPQLGEALPRRADDVNELPDLAVEA